MEVAKEIRDGVDRLIEQFQLEGRNILELPEQLAVALAIGVCRKMSKQPIIKVDRHGEEDEEVYSKVELYAVMRDNRIWLEILEAVSEVKSRQLRRELLRLAKSLLEAYPEVSLTDFSPLGAVMEYLLDAVFRVGNQNCFFTPVNIARLMIGLVQPYGGTLWDPACGSGTFLVEAARGWKGAYQPELYGTDINEQMRRIARINIFFHGIKGAEIALGDALEEKKLFDVIVANPPVTTGRGTDRLYGHIAPTPLLHLQFLQMIPEHLRSSGKAAVLVNENVLFSQKKAETKIREALVEQHGLWAVISLPKGAFAPYTNAKSSILFFGGKWQPDEALGVSRKPRGGILFYELHRLGYTLDRKHAATEENDIPDALEVCAEREFHFDSWKRALQEGGVYNADGVKTPENWKEENFWFADIETVRGNGYILLADRYRPRKQKEQETQEDYRKLLERLLCLEREAAKQMEELKEVFDGDWM